MPDFSRSDLSEIERTLRAIVDKLSGPAFTANPATSLERVSDKLDKVISELRDISKKLERR